MIKGTEKVHPDEKAFLLVERNLVRPPRFTLRRYRIIYVVRDGDLAEHWEDLGPTKSDVMEFRIPAFFEHTVGELMDIADDARKSSEHWTKRQAELSQESSLIRDFVAYADVRQAVKQRRSVYGPGYSKQRSW